MRALKVGRVLLDLSSKRDKAQLVMLVLALKVMLAGKHELSRLRAQTMFGQEESVLVDVLPPGRPHGQQMNKLCIEQSG